MGHTCISLFFAPPSSHCWMKAQMQKKWVWFKVGGQTSQAKPRHIKPSRPLLLEQVLICRDSEMLQHRWTRSPLSLSLTHTNKHVPADLFCRCVCAHLFDWSFHKPLSQPGMNLRWVRFYSVHRVCLLAFVTVGCFPKRQRNSTKISPYGTNKVSNQLRIPGVFNTVKARWEGGIMSSPHNFFQNSS